jgi:LysM repeat protein
MSDKDSAQNVIEAYRRRQQSARRAPLIIVAAVLAIAGLGLLVYWLLGSGGPSLPSIALFASETPTPTDTATATATATASSTPTETPTPTFTVTPTLVPTQSGPFIYKVEDGDNLWSIAQKFKADLLVLITINNLDPANPTILVGKDLIIPGPDTQLPSATPLPADLRKGTKIDYQVQLGDSLLSIAIKFNSTVEDIKKENKIDNENQIFVGQKLVIPVNMVTAVPTATPAPTTVLTIGGTPVPTAITPGAPASSPVPTVTKVP